MDHERYTRARKEQDALAYRALAALRAMDGISGMPAFAQEIAHSANTEWRAINVEIMAALDAPDRMAA